MTEKSYKTREWTSLRDEILQLFFSREKDRPVLIGTVAMHLKSSLSEAEEVMVRMDKEDGVIRPLTKAELRDRNLSHAYVRHDRALV